MDVNVQDLCALTLNVICVCSMKMWMFYMYDGECLLARIFKIQHELVTGYSYRNHFVISGVQYNTWFSCCDIVLWFTEWTFCNTSETFLFNFLIKFFCDQNFNGKLSFGRTFFRSLLSVLDEINFPCNNLTNAFYSSIYVRLRWRVCVTKSSIFLTERLIGILSICSSADFICSSYMNQSIKQQRLLANIEICCWSWSSILIFFYLNTVHVWILGLAFLFSQSHFLFFLL